MKLIPVRTILDQLASNPVATAGCVMAAASVSLAIWMRRENLKEEVANSRPGRLVVISGCDSGLGLAMSYWAAKLGYKVLAGCYNLDSDGAKYLKKEFPECDLQVTELDVTKGDSLEKFRVTCQNIIQSSNGSTKLWAVIPNSAVGCFGEYFWMTEPMCRRMMEVNFWGAINLTSTFRQLLLHFKSRLIVITSDCADYPLPGLSIYSASKAALENWACALRLELAKFGVCVTSFQPGNFPKQSRLFAGQRQTFDEMKRSMSAEELEFYGTYFTAYHEQLITFFDATVTKELKEEGGIRKAFLYLLEGNIELVPVKSQNPLELHVLHTLFKYLPIRASDWLKNRLLGTLTWNPKEYPLNIK